MMVNERTCWKTSALLHVDFESGGNSKCKTKGTLNNGLTV